MEDRSQRSSSVVHVRVQVAISGGLGDQAEVPDGDSVSGVVQVAPVRVGDVVEVGVLLSIQRGVVVHRGGVIDLLGEPSAI